MIPKTIHFCRFWWKPKGDVFQKCYASRVKYCPEREIVERNESNIDVNSHEFMKRAYKNKKWAFVSDVARLQVLLKQWWVYLDTDMELLKPIDRFLDNQVFQWFESKESISCWIIWSTSGHEYIKLSLAEYDNEENYRTIPNIMSDVAQSLIKESTLEPWLKREHWILLLPQDYFYPLPAHSDYDSKFLTENSHGIHRREQSWRTRNQKIVAKFRYWTTLGKYFNFLIALMRSLTKIAKESIFLLIYLVFNIFVKVKEITVYAWSEPWEDFDVDLVYLRVNMDDLKRKNKKNKHLEGLQRSDDFSWDIRYHSFNELKFSLRSVDNYAPWIRNIYIITDNQIPDWLDTRSNKIHIIDHKELIPSNYLPLFNTNALEAFIPNIKGLSERFLYSNDDTMFWSKVTRSDFFSSDWSTIRSQKDICSLPIFNVVPSAKDSSYTATIKNTFSLMKHEAPYWKLHHQIKAFIKSEAIQINNSFIVKEQLSLTKSNKFRTMQDINPPLLWQLSHIISKKMRWSYISQVYYEFDSKPSRSNYGMYILHKLLKPKLVCANNVTDKTNHIFNKYFKHLFPNPSIYEK